jgi:gamma-glutamyl-gamma-aminobutyrate hydrolase PuuD
VKNLTLGYCDHGPQMGPFSELFGAGVRLMSKQNLDGIDAVLLWGGEDISPSLYGEKSIPGSGPKHPSSRDLFEWEVLKQAQKKGIPVIGVCRGAQMMCAFVGGKLIQNVSGHGGGTDHDVDTYDNKVFLSTSYHHQMMYPYEVEHELLAWSTEHKSRVYQPADTHHAAAYEKRLQKEPEAVYFPQLKGFAVQGHPEWQSRSSYTFWCLEQIKEKCLKEFICEC